MIIAKKSRFYQTVTWKVLFSVRGGKELTLGGDGIKICCEKRGGCGDFSCGEEMSIFLAGGDPPSPQ